MSTSTSHRYNASTILTAVDQSLKTHYGDVSVDLSDNHVTYEEALLSTVYAVQNLPANGHKYIGLPSTNPARRAALRKLALDTDVLSSSTSNNALPIRSSGQLSSQPTPKPVSRERRAAFKAHFFGENEPPYRAPYVLRLTASITEHRLATIYGQVTVAAIDHEDSMPKATMEHAELLWDTGAHETIITSDFLPSNFVSFLQTDPINDPYRLASKTKVQVSFTLEFSNSILFLETSATVVQKETVPNHRSGIILGQKGCIENMQYRSIPRAILEVQGQKPGTNVWGDLIIESFLHWDGSLIIP
ncbi:hypothetical protein N7495_002875 [Penicillium taxi]|uniref:uncharacterized protein n=1 Tax=Penicillium taxi TaxID=168475 RepID=UPI00254574E7|nr:uncharacterized protein N7495_002875 [Penicillium taxi]KAJ5902347.1 hypothetical protein N7495_002875 [Penicillium taxi]